MVIRFLRWFYQKRTKFAISVLHQEEKRMRSFNHIATLIKNKRLVHPKGYSQSELSNLLGYKNGQFISNVERALCNIPLKMLGKVCEVLDINSSELKEAILKDHDETLDNYLTRSKEKKNLEQSKMDTTENTHQVFSRAAGQ